MRHLGSLLVVLSAQALGAEQESAVLQVITSPSGAAITIDGKLVGLSPRSERLAPGIHTISAEQSGSSTSQTLSLIAGEERKLTLLIVPPLTPRPAPVIGLVTFGGGALALGVGLLLTLPARAAAREVNLLFQRGGGWDDHARLLEQAGLSAQTWSSIFSVVGVAVMASGLIVTGIELFGRRIDLPTLVLVPMVGGAVFTGGVRW